MKLYSSCCLSHPVEKYESNWESFPQFFWGKKNHTVLNKVDPLWFFGLNHFQWGFVTVLYIFSLKIQAELENKKNKKHAKQLCFNPGWTGDKSKFSRLSQLSKF